MLATMSRLGLFAILLGLGACSGCASGSQDAQPSKPPAGGDKIAVPGGDPGKGPTVGGGDGDRAKLHAAEGTLAVDAPADAKAGAESTAKITVKPGAGYHVNTEYPIKYFTLTAPRWRSAVPKVLLEAGGHDKAKGDADQLDEQNLTFSVKLTPSKTGSYTVNGSFKFAVCDNLRSVLCRRRSRSRSSWPCEVADGSRRAREGAPRGLGRGGAGRLHAQPARDDVRGVRDARRRGARAPAPVVHAVHRRLLRSLRALDGRLPMGRCVRSVSPCSTRRGRTARIVCSVRSKVQNAVYISTLRTFGAGTAGRTS